LRESLQLGWQAFAWWACQIASGRMSYSGDPRVPPQFPPEPTLSAELNAFFSLKRALPSAASDDDIEPSSAKQPTIVFQQHQVPSTILPAGWSEHSNPVDGRRFYLNQSNGAVQWDFPTTPAIALGQNPLFAQTAPAKQTFPPQFLPTQPIQPQPISPKVQQQQQQLHAAAQIAISMEPAPSIDQTTAPQPLLPPQPPLPPQQPQLPLPPQQPQQLAPALEQQLPSISVLQQRLAPIPVPQQQHVQLEYVGIPVDLVSSVMPILFQLQLIKETYGLQQAKQAALSFMQTATATTSTLASSAAAEEKTTPPALPSPLTKASTFNDPFPPAE